jgi:hypothetical protein
MTMLKEAIVQECLIVLKRNDVKDELKKLFSPIIDLIIIQIYPYLYLCLMFVLISFLLHLGIFILLLRNKSFFSKGS